MLHHLCLSCRELRRWPPVTTGENFHKDRRLLPILFRPAIELCLAVHDSAASQRREQGREQGKARRRDTVASWSSPRTHERGSVAMMSCFVLQAWTANFRCEPNNANAKIDDECTRKAATVKAFLSGLIRNTPCPH